MGFTGQVTKGSVAAGSSLSFCAIRQVVNKLVLLKQGVAWEVNYATR